MTPERLAEIKGMVAVDAEPFDSVSAWDAINDLLAHIDTLAGEWRCFHCGEVFTSKVDAALHFGSERAMSTPACLIKQEGEFALLTALRNAEERCEQLSSRQDDTDVMRAMWSMQTDRARALREEEEKGYARGLRDANHTEPAPPKPEVTS